ncbi:MAG: hypothetical protein JRD68_05545 [Deltaproteobacteria bacterium]|nr:hypothetical protein [Deltaproteobacteria bacterium]
MRCPKCGLTSFDYNDACPKCGRDLAPLREQLGLLNVAPQPLFLLESLFGQGEAEAGDDDFTFEQGETEHLGTYDGDSSGIQEEGVSVADMEEVATLEFEADPESQAEETGIEMPSEGEIDFIISDEESSLEIEGEEAGAGITSEEPLDFSDSDETLILEPEEAGIQLESESEDAETLIMEPEDEGLQLETEPETKPESPDEEEPPGTDDEELDPAALDLEPEGLNLNELDSDETLIIEPEDSPASFEAKPEIELESLDGLELNLDSDDEDEPPRTDDDELDLAALDLEPEGLDFSDIESGVEKAVEAPAPSEETEIRDFSDSDETLIIEGSETDDDFLDLGIEPEEETSGDAGDQELDLTGLSVEEEEVLTSGEDEGDDQGLTRSEEKELDDLESHLEDETLILEDSAESESPIFYDSDDDDLDEIELDFDDLELELEEDN